MNKKDFIKKARNMLVTAATGIVVSSGMTSCTVRGTEHIDNWWKEKNPDAELNTNKNYKSKYDLGSTPTHNLYSAEKKTDSLAIKQIKEKYLFKLTQFKEMFDSIIIKQQKADSTLLNAAQKGDLTKVQEALEVMGANVNAQDAKTGNTAIMMAKEKLPFEKAFLIAKYLVAEPGYNPDVENKDGISFMDMLDAELSKGSAAWQSISRKSDMLNPDKTRTRDNTETSKAIAQLQEGYDSLMSTYGKEMKEALGYQATAEIYTGQFCADGRDREAVHKSVINEDGSRTKYNKVYKVFSETSSIEEKNILRDNILDTKGTLEIEKLNPKNIDFKTLANELTLEEMSVHPESIQDAQQSVETTRGYNHGSIDAKTYMNVRGRRGSYSTVEIKTHVEGNKVR